MATDWLSAEVSDLPLWKKAWRVLTPAQQRDSVWLAVLLIVGMLFETLSLGMVVPALALMVTDEPGKASPYLSACLERLGNPSRESLIVGGVMALLVVVLVKAIFLLYVAWSQLRLTAGIHASVARRLFSTYLSQPWTFHLQRNSSELIRNAAFESGLFAGVISSFLYVCSDTLVMLGISSLLLFLQPLGTVVTAVVLGASTLLFQRLTAPAIARWGVARQHHEAKKLQHIQQGLAGAKDVKVLGREHEFIKRFHHHTEEHARIQQRQGFVAQIPRLWYEIVAVAGLCLLSTTMVMMDVPPSAFVPTLGLFAACAFKMLPSINRMLLNSQSIRYATPAVNTLFAELSLPGGDPVEGQVAPLALTTELKFCNVCYRYPGGRSEAVSNVSLRIPKGAAVGFIGESGAGKSTLVDILLGLLEPTSGTVTVDGTAVGDNARGWQSIIGYVPQSIYLSDDTLRRNVAFGLRDEQIDEEAVARSLRAAQLEDFVKELADGLNTFVGERGVRLSGGQRQRIGIARALYHNPAVLVLDEATSALDAETERSVMEAVNSLHGEKTLVIVAHRLSTVANCDIVYRLNKGRVVAAGSLSDVS